MYTLYTKIMLVLSTSYKFVTVLDLKLVAFFLTIVLYTLKYASLIESALHIAFLSSARSFE